MARLKIHGEEELWGYPVEAAFPVLLEGEPTIALLYFALERDVGVKMKDYATALMEAGEPARSAHRQWNIQNLPDTWIALGVWDDVILCEKKLDTRGAPR